MLIEQKDEITQAAEAAWKVAAKYNRGQIVPYDELETAIGDRRYEGIWSTVIDKLLRRLLKERQIDTVAVTNVGYRLLTHVEQVTVSPQRRQKRAFRQTTKAVKAIKAVDSTTLPLHARRMKLFYEDRFRSIREHSFRPRPIGRQD